MLKKILLIIGIIIILFLVFRNINFSEPFVSGGSFDSGTISSDLSNTDEMPEKEYLTMNKTKNSQPLDIQNSRVTWFGENKIQAKNHAGTIGLSNISSIGLTSDEEGGDLRVESGYIVIDMTTLSGNEGEPQQMIDHLRSEDFFNVDSYPQAQFSVSEATDSEVRGSLTIKGTSRDISFPYTLESINSKIVMTGQFSIDRTEWGITTLSGSFFYNVGDAIIEDTITITFVLVTESQ